MIFTVDNKAATGSIAAAAGGGTAVVATLRFFRGRMFIRRMLDDASLAALRFFLLLLLLEAGDDDDDDRSSMTCSLLADPCRLLVGEFPFAVAVSTNVIVVAENLIFMVVVVVLWNVASWKRRSVNKKRRNAKDNSSAIVSLKHKQGTSKTKQTDVHDETPPPFQWSHCW
jgi:hypothetical protein